MTDSSLAKPQGFETKSLPHGYAPAAVPEFHQQHRDPGYANSEGESGDEPQDWPTSDAVAGKFSSESSGDNTEAGGEAGDTGGDKTSTRRSRASTGAKS
jgi:hypothetical protein